MPSPLLDAYGRPLDAARIRGAYAQTGRLMDGGAPATNLPYWRASFREINQEVTPAEWARIVAASQKLYANLGPVKGAVQDKAVYSVGRAWQPEFLGIDQQWGAEAEEWLMNEWYGIADIRGEPYDFVTDLYLASVCIDRDGEAFGMLTAEEDGYPKITFISPNRVGERTNTAQNGRIATGPYAGLKTSHGVAFNDRGRAVAYHVMGDTEAEDRWLSARSMMHLYDPEWPGQARGFPMFAHAIRDLRSLITTQGYEEQAAMLASEIGLIEENPMGGPDMSDPAVALMDAAADLNPTRPATGLVTKTLEGGGYRYFQAGTNSKITTMVNSRPGQNWESFMDRLIRNGCAGAGWPYELVWKGSELGGANIRLLVARAMRAVADRQDLLRPFAKRAVGYAVSVAIAQGRLRPSEEWYKWGFSMPPEMTVDAGYDSQSAGEEIADGRRTLTDYLASRSIKLKDHIKKLKKEQQMIADAGLNIGAETKPEPAEANDAIKKDAAEAAHDETASAA